MILLLVSVWINYIDRGNLSVAAPALTSELGLTPTQMGLLLSAFFWTYASSQVIAGWLVDRFKVVWVYGLGFLLWSVATCVTGLISGFPALFSLRLLLGLGESVAYPAYSRIIAANYAEDQRGVANSLIDAGSKAGPALGTLLGGLFMARFGWRVFFIAIGLASLAWLGPWFAWAPRERTAGPDAVQNTPGIGEILRKRSAWGTFLGLFCANYTWYFLITWLPSYLVKERHLSMSRMALLGSLPFWSIAAGSLLGGWASDRWISRGATPNRVRKTFAVTGLLMVTLILPAAIVPDLRLSTALLVIACFCFGFFTSNLWAITQTLAGSAAAGKWTGMQNGVGNLAGVVAPWLTGFIVHKTGEFLLAFVAAAAVSVIGAMMFLFVVGRVTPVAWSRAQAAG